MTVLVTGANGQLGCWHRLAASGSAAVSTSDENYFSCGSSKNQFPSSSNAPARAADPQIRYLFSDIAELSEESAETLRRLGGEGVDFSTVFLDITDLSAVRELVRRERVDVVVNCAAFTNVDAAESQPEVAERLNAAAVENLAVAMKEVGGLLVHVSTDYVFGARAYDAPIREEEPGAPTGVYGLTKLHGEEAIRRVGCRHVIIRTGWMYSEFGKNFVRTMLHLTSTRPQIKVVNDQRGTPTYARDLAEAIVTILAAVSSSDAAPAPSDAGSPSSFAGSLSSFAGVSGESPARHPDALLGTYNYSNAGECTWYDFARAIAELAGHGSCEILPCRSDEFPSPVRRPAYSVLDKAKIQATFGLSLPAWPDSLRRCLASLV